MSSFLFFFSSWTFLSTLLHTKLNTVQPFRRKSCHLWPRGLIAFYMISTNHLCKTSPFSSISSRKNGCCKFPNLGGFCNVNWVVLSSPLIGTGFCFLRNTLSDIWISKHCHYFLWLSFSLKIDVLKENCSMVIVMGFLKRAVINVYVKSSIFIYTLLFFESKIISSFPSLCPEAMFFALYLNQEDVQETFSRCVEGFG